MKTLPRCGIVAVAVAALTMTVTAPARAQSPGPRRTVIGEWTGTLVLDNSSPRVSLVFDSADSALVGKVYSDGGLLGSMEELSLKGDTVHFKVDRLDFTGRVGGVTMTVDLIVYNGTHRTLTLKKTPELGREPSAAPPSGSLQEHVLYDSSYHRPRHVWIYTPPGYDGHRADPYPLLFAFDGAEYRDTMPLPHVLDSLAAAHRAPPFVAVLVDDSVGPVRIADLGNAPRMAEFLARQLIPFVRKGWNVTTDPHRVIVTGSSAGGLGAAYVALTRPDLFGNVWSQSGAFWRGADASNDAPYEWLTQYVKRSAKKDVRLVLDVGELEDHPTLGGSGPNFRDANRRFRDALVAKGYAVTYTEVPGGNHAEQWWRPRLAGGVVALSASWSVSAARR
jgi:enterochelin esterase-like enzyme